MTSQAKNLTPAEVKLYRSELWQAIKRKDHEGWRRPAPAPTRPSESPVPAPYAAMISQSPQKAIDVAWHDAERAALGALEAKMTFAGRTQPIPIGALVSMLRQFASVDQADPDEFARLATVQKAVAEGAAAT